MVGLMKQTLQVYCESKPEMERTEGNTFVY